MYSQFPLVEVLPPVRLERDVVLHSLVPEEQVLVSPLTGGGGGRQNQVSDMSLCSSELYWSIESVDLVESSPRGKSHQICGDGLHELVREGQAGSGDKVQRKWKDWRRSLVTALREPQL